MEHVEQLGCPEVWDCAGSLTTIKVARNGVGMSALRIPEALTLPLGGFHEQTSSLFFPVPEVQQPSAPDSCTNFLGSRPEKQSTLV